MIAPLGVAREPDATDTRNEEPAARLDQCMTDTVASGALKVDIWSDVACPWCYIGKRRFEEGARRYRDGDGGRDVEVEYHSFELAPDTPVDFEGTEVDFLVQYKGMAAVQVRQMLAQVSEVAASVGLAYDFDALQHTKTVKAHQVLHVAKEQGLQVEMKERLLRAYFVEGRHVGHDDGLADLAVEVGLDRALVLDALRSGSYAQRVQEDIRQARSYGISGVPFFVIDGRYGVSGAQPPESFVQALTRAASD
jgi:predicted DsbA family dithiol-disulfide isomerase